MALLELKDIIRYFVNDQVRTDVLKGISLSVEEGEYVSIMGPSGSGKSTFLNIIGCLDKASSGTYKIGDTYVDALSENELADMRNHEIGFVFQSFHLLRNLSATANVELPLIYRGMPAAERKKKAHEALTTVGLSHRFDHFPKQLSGGEQQRVAIARAIVGNPKLILADEPTGALDSKTSRNVMEIFRSLNQDRGMTIIQVTHDAKVPYYGTRIVYLADGEIYREEKVDPSIAAEILELHGTDDTTADTRALSLQEEGNKEAAKQKKKAALQEEAQREEVKNEQR